MARVKGWITEDRIDKALSENRVLRILYTRLSDDEQSVRDIEPVCIYECKDGYPMLMAYCRLREDYRTFRVDAIQDSLLKYETFNYRDHLERLAKFLVSQLGIKFMTESYSKMKDHDVKTMRIGS